MADPVAQFARDGFIWMPWSRDISAWAEAAFAAAVPRVRDPALRAAWLRHGGTWFAGVDVLPNDADGRVGGCALAGPVLDLVQALGLWPKTWHAAQVSVTYPGYPQADPGDSPGVARYRHKRDAAHLDGLHAEGAARRRVLREPHAFILGLPLTKADPAAAPLVVWPGSHQVMAQALSPVLRKRPAAEWAQVDLTEPYQAGRRRVFETCHRVEVVAAPGEAILLHRHMLHGIAPWAKGAQAAPEGRMIAYFRPCFAQFGPWLTPRSV